MAMQVADHLLADALGPRAEEENNANNQGDTRPEPISLPVDQLAALEGEYFSEELDATYRFAMNGDELTVRVEQEAPAVVRPTGNDEFEISYYDIGAYGPWRASIQLTRDDDGAIAGFDLSSGSETGLVFVLRN